MEGFSWTWRNEGDSGAISEEANFGHVGEHAYSCGRWCSIERELLQYNYDLSCVRLTLFNYSNAPSTTPIHGRCTYVLSSYILRLRYQLSPLHWSKRGVDGHTECRLDETTVMVSYVKKNINMFFYNLKILLPLFRLLLCLLDNIYVHKIFFECFLLYTILKTVKRWVKKIYINDIIFIF